MELGRLGLWSGELRSIDAAQAASVAAEVEALGYGTLWVPGRSGGPVLDLVGALLDATSRLVVATGILNISMHEPADVRDAWHRLEERHPGRFLLGLGVSHGRYRKPLAAMRAYLDELDSGPDAVPAERRVLAALGPRMLALSGERTAGAHPYFVLVAHTAAARELLGDGPLLAPEQAVTLQEDREADRRAARAHMERYLTLPNYTNNLLRHGFEPDDLRDGGSDRLADAIVAGGGLDGIRERVEQHRAAGADHVSLQVVGATPDKPPLAQWRALAATLR
jgi:probable F420-dependent oxidoreductase